MAVVLGVVVAVATGLVVGVPPELVAWLAQVLITVETVEHAIHLKKRLPEFELVYAVPADRYAFNQDLTHYREQGLVDNSAKHYEAEIRGEL